MQMHMLGVMFAPNDTLTLMAMFPYVKKEMDHVAKDGRTFTTETDGIGDIKASALYQFYKRAGHSLIANAGISFPSGSIDERGDTLMPDVKFPYPMQLGSGTVDLLPGITYLGSKADWSWGGQAFVTVRLGENDNSYTLGDRADATAWVVRNMSASFSASARLNSSFWADIDGADPDLGTVFIVPTADPDLRHGKRVDILLGFNATGTKGALKNMVFQLEGGIPVYQYLDGPQLEIDWILTAGIQWMR